MTLAPYGPAQSKLQKDNNSTYRHRQVIIGSNEIWGGGGGGGLERVLLESLERFQEHDQLTK